MREVVIVRTVGATKNSPVRIFSPEFVVIGIATVLSSVLVGQLLDAPYHFRWLPAGIATAITATLTVTAGWIASYGVLRKKPPDILRNIE